MDRFANGNMAARFGGCNGGIAWTVLISLYGPATPTTALNLFAELEMFPCCLPGMMLGLREMNLLWLWIFRVWLIMQKRDKNL